MYIVYISVDFCMLICTFLYITVQYHTLLNIIVHLWTQLYIIADYVTLLYNMVQYWCISMYNTVHDSTLLHYIVYYCTLLCIGVHYRCRNGYIYYAQYYIYCTPGFMYSSKLCCLLYSAMYSIVTVKCTMYLSVTLLYSIQCT